MKRFRPKLVPTLATLLTVPILVSLGFWQLDRAAQKRVLAEQFEQGLNSGPVSLTAQVLSRLAQNEWSNVVGNGQYTGKIFLLDNRVRDRRAGYDVISPLVSASTNGERLTVLVNRGWVPAPAERGMLPELGPLATIATTAMVSGRLGPPPAAGIVLDQASHLIEQLGNGIYRMQRFEFDQLESILNTSLPRHVLYLDDDAAHGYARAWPTPGINPAKHEAYATQWFAMAIIVFGLFIGLNWRTRTPCGDHD